MQSAELSNWEKTRHLTKRVIELVKSDAKYGFCFFALMVNKLANLLNIMFIILWMTSFVESGVIESDGEVKTIFKNVMTFSMISTALLLPIFGWIVDATPPHIVLPVIFLVRAVIAGQFQLIDDP